MDAVDDLRKPWNPLGLRKVLGRYRVVRAGRDALIGTQIWVKRRRQGLDISAYLRRHQVRCLQIGAGPTSASGWLRTDLMPSQPGCVYLNALERFPIPDESFDYVHSEHMIEHVPFFGGRAMLAECYRILRPGGRIRIATPDLARLIGLYGRDNDGVAQRLIELCAQGVYKSAECAKPIFAINNTFHNWGHQFLYDEETLRSSLLAVGFVDVERFRCGESRTDLLKGMELHGSLSGELEVNEFETQVLEAQKPRGPRPGN